ncbi:MAG: ATP-binding protein [Nitrospiraceae bacterium]|nr:ATP-binding protein [Nitrospiraceae bacterium]
MAEKRDGLPQARMELLNCAFDSFTKASKSLEASYQALQQRIAALTLELKDKNAKLGEALREAEKNKDYLDAVLYSMEEAIIVLDPAERITMINRASGLLLGEAARGAIGKKYSDLDISLRHDGSVAVLGTGGKSYHVIVEDSPVIDSNGASLGRVIQIKDVTGMMQMEALHERNKRLISLGEMAAKIVHEIRNPLCSIELFASMLERDVPDGKLKELAGGISAGIHSLNNILTNMLFFARPHRPSVSDVELEVLVEEVLRLMAPFMEARKVRAETLCTAPPAVRGDGELLKQILMNLVINAVQAMPEGGLLKVRLGEDGGCPFIEVKDEGAGIAPDLMEKIFDPFFSTKEKGTGLGLAIASKIMQAHGGYIKVASVPGKGSTFGMCFTGDVCQSVSPQAWDAPQGSRPGGDGDF